MNNSLNIKPLNMFTKIDFNLPKNHKYKVLKTAYFKPIYDENWRMTNRDVLIMTIKDITAEKTFMRIFPEPRIDYFYLKDLNEADYPKINIDYSKVEKINCKYRERDKSILQTLGRWNEAYQLKKQSYESYRDYLEKYVRNSPLLYASDINIEDWYKTLFELEYEIADIFPLNKAYFDIETDISKYDASENNPEGAITVITYFFQNTKTFYIFALVLPESPSQQEVIDNIESFKQKYLTENDIKDTNDITYVFEFYENEVLLLRSFFDILHKTQPDVLSAWNSPYDVKYIINRARLLNINVANLICSPEVPDEYKRLTYLEDPDRNRKNNQYYHRLWDWVDVSNYTNIIDTMSLYSNLRKRYQAQSYALYNIALLELGFTKVNLSSFGLSIRTAHLVDYPRFLQYAITDTYLLYMIEEKTEDMTRYISLSDNTRLSKGIKISIIIKNLLFKTFAQQFKIIGNSISYPTNESLEGALVATPDNVDIKSADMYNNQKSRVYDNVIDMDGKALYPNQMRPWNICKNTVEYRILSLFRDNNPNELIIQGKEFMQFLETLDTSIFTLGSKVFNLPDIDFMIEDIETNNIL